MKNAVMVAITMLAAAASASATTPPPPTPFTTEGKYAAFSVVASTTGGAGVVVGTASKHARNPLMVQDKAWEPRFDNGYPNILHDPNSNAAPYQLWWGGCCGHMPAPEGKASCDVQLWEYATSQDGLAWDKPDLGLFDLGTVWDGFKDIGTKNNVVLKGGGIGVYRDRNPHAPEANNASRAFKAFGVGCFGPGGGTACVSGTAVSADGLRWTDAASVSWPKPQRYDDHQNILWDARHGRYLLTTRAYTSASGRDIALATSGGTAFGNWSKTADLVESGSEAHQLYSQITFPFYNIYLGLVMVFDTADPTTVGTVECRLSWSPDGEKWGWVYEALGDDDGDDDDAGAARPRGLAGSLGGPSIIPHGAAGAFDSHIVFAASHPFTPLSAANGDDVQLYYMGGNVPS